MRKLFFTVATVILVSPALATDAPTVSLTQDELSAYANAVQAQTAAQLAAAQAKPVLDKIKAAFTPTSPKPAEAPAK